MRKLTVKIVLENAAFDGDFATAAELDFISRRMVGKIRDGVTAAYVYDTNGNEVGEWSIDEVD